MKKLMLLMLIGCTVLLMGCRSIPMTSDSLDSDAKKFQPEPGKASVYINRREAFVGAGNIVQTVIDGRIMGSLVPGTYQLISVVPGEHILTYTGQFDDPELTKVQTENGKNYFFDFYVSTGWMAPHVNIRQITDEEGRKNVMASKRAEISNW